METVDWILLFIIFLIFFGVPFGLVIKGISDRFYEQLIWPLCQKNKRYMKLYLANYKHPKKVWEIIKADMKGKMRLIDDEAERIERIKNGRS